MTSDNPNNGCKGDYSLNDCEVSGASRPSAKGAPGHPDPEIRERKGFSKKFLFSALRASLCSKKKGLGEGAPPLGSSPGPFSWICHWN